MYEDTYTCLKPNAIDYCAPLTAAGCWQTSARCIQTDTLFGTGCMTATYTYRCNDPSRPTPPNTVRLADSYTLVSSVYVDTCASPGAGCALAENRCIQTVPDSPLPPGISPSAVAPDGCYKREKVYACYSAPPPSFTGCSASRTTCVDATPSKVVDGVTVTLAMAGGCWKYKDECVTSKDAVDYCAPLAVNPQCRQTSESCIQTDTTLGTGCMKYRRTYRCNDPSLPTPPNTVRLADSYTLVSSVYNKAPCSEFTARPTCHLAESRCIQTVPDSPLPPGISPSAVAPDGCYKREEVYACLTGKADNACAEYANNPNCTLQSSKCDEDSMVGGQCVSKTSTYKCLSAPAKTSTIADCGTQKFCLGDVCFDSGFASDADFAQVMTYMEAMREAGTYIDEGDLRLFKGVDSRCTKNGLTNCCKARGGSAPSNAAYVKTIFDAAKMGYDYMRSPYMYDALFQSEMPNWMLRSIYGASGPLTSPIPKFSYYGFTVQYGSSTVTTSWLGNQLGVNAIALTPPGSSFVIAFDPMSFAISLAVSFIFEELMSCDQSDIMTAMRKSNNLCVFVGDYCSSKKLGFCIENKESYCCFNSRLAKIINVEGRKQLGKGWGSAKSPDCSGFTPAELQSLDFSRMDLSAFYAEIVPKNLDTNAIKTSIQNKIVANPNRQYFDGR